MFQFDSVQAFWQMAGHGPYVWFCYAVTVTLMTLLIAQPLYRKRQLVRLIKADIRREQAALQTPQIV